MFSSHHRQVGGYPSNVEGYGVDKRRFVMRKVCLQLNEVYIGEKYIPVVREGQELPEGENVVFPTKMENEYYGKMYFMRIIPRTKVKNGSWDIKDEFWDIEQNRDYDLWIAKETYKRKKDAPINPRIIIADSAKELLAYLVDLK